MPRAKGNNSFLKRKAFLSQMEDFPFAYCRYTIRILQVLHSHMENRQYTNQGKRLKTIKHFEIHDLYQSPVFIRCSNFARRFLSTSWNKLFNKQTLRKD